jgi:tetratricopeptide (TPR) repeat protein
VTIDTALDLRRSGRHDEARALLCDLAAKYPHDAKVQYQAACVHDFLGLESEAVPFYLACLDGTLPAEDRLGALLGLGSTYRTLGRYAEAEAVLLKAIQEFPQANELKVFLAMVFYNLGRSKEAIESLLQLLATTTSDSGIKQYARALALYARDIDHVWSERDA